VFRKVGSLFHRRCPASRKSRRKMQEVIVPRGNLISKQQGLFHGCILSANTRKGTIPTIAVATGKSTSEAGTGCFPPGWGKVAHPHNNFNSSPPVFAVALAVHRSFHQYAQHAAPPNFIFLVKGPLRMKEIPSFQFKFKLFGLELSGTGKLGIFAALFLALLTLLFLFASTYLQGVAEFA